MEHESGRSFRQRFSSWYHRPAISGPVLLVFLLSLVVFAAGPYANIPVLIGLVLVVALSVLRDNGFGRLGYRRPSSWWRVILVAIVLAFVFEIGSALWLEPYVASVTGSETDLGVFDVLHGNLPNTLAMIGIGWIVGGFLEEMFFRGFLVQETGRLLGGRMSGYVIGVIVSSVVFGLSHYYQGPTGMIMTGLFGFAFGVIYLLNARNLWLNILIHGFVDTIGITALYFGGYEAVLERLSL